MTIGVLALQGDVREHLGALGEIGVACRSVRTEPDLDGVHGLVLPGGESTTLSLLLQSSGLFEPLGALIAAGFPVFGTCAGLVLLATEVHGGRPDQRGFGALDCTVLRNGYGRQSRSAEATVEVAAALGGPGSMPAVFIRAPMIESVGPEVEVLSWWRAPGADRRLPVACRQGPVLASAFHPELTTDRRLHRLFVGMVEASEPAGGRTSVRVEPAR
ncbi:MAG: pyridoxal 5'-phosphate synthase glutaminase subunit PdxT [Acidimicrobiales bacterium]